MTEGTEGVLPRLIEERRAECRTRLQSSTELLKGGCPLEFDGWSCVPQTRANSTSFFPCPNFIFGFDPSRLGERRCLEDGTWFRHPLTNRTWSNYTSCVDLDDLQMRTRINLIYKAGYTLSLIALLVSIFIFFYFKCLRCTRIELHKNLFISLAVNNLLWLVWYQTVVDNIALLVANPWWCKVMHVVVSYFLVSGYLWMFCEGLYLHTLLVSPFLSESSLLCLLYLIGWAAPALLVVLYAALRATHPQDSTHCWIHESGYSWALSGPVCVSMLANLVFLVNIVRLLLAKLPPNKLNSHHGREMGRERSETVVRAKKGVRATLILVPLLGLQYMAMPFRPDQGTLWDHPYQFISAVVTSSQGLCVALLFCFFNGEVVGAIKKKWAECRWHKEKRWHSSSAPTSLSESHRPGSQAEQMMDQTV